MTTLGKYRNPITLIFFMALVALAIAVFVLSVLVIVAYSNGKYFFPHVYGLTGANITDGKIRLSPLQNEDFSFSLFGTLNGTTKQVAGYDNLTQAIGSLIVIEALSEVHGWISEMDIRDGYQK